MPHGRSGSVLASLARTRQEGTSRQRNGEAWCPQHLVHNTHAATTELFQNAVVRNGLTDECVGVRHSAVIWVAT